MRTVPKWEQADVAGLVKCGKILRHSPAHQPHARLEPQLLGGSLECRALRTITDNDQGSLRTPRLNVGESSDDIHYSSVGNEDAHEEENLSFVANQIGNSGRWGLGGPKLGDALRGIANNHQAFRRDSEFDTPIARLNRHDIYCRRSPEDVAFDPFRQLRCPNEAFEGPLALQQADRPQELRIDLSHVVVDRNPKRSAEPDCTRRERQIANQNQFRPGDSHDSPDRQQPDRIDEKWKIERVAQRSPRNARQSPNPHPGLEKPSGSVLRIATDEINLVPRARQDDGRFPGSSGPPGPLAVIDAEQSHGSITPARRSQSPSSERPAGTLYRGIAQRLASVVYQPPSMSSAAE